ncbi:glycosyltransferase [Tardiphaga alba]|uniref:Glycosyltransferase n=1 Tax=Tardiphaga alba TaxID=340268 RepID=A0ABX8A3W5_9BRAD|nr:glycosyltransferase [Tardiphaga alba]QUS37941.1 glycosyltransferase [Tardiphaga alba]
MALLDHDGYPEPFLSPGRALLPRQGQRLPDNDNDLPRDVLPIAPELYCLVGLIAFPTLTAATNRSYRVGVGANQILIDWGEIDEASYIRHLAAHLGIPVAPLGEGVRGHRPLAPEDYASAATMGLLSARHGPGSSFVVAPRFLSSRRLTELALERPELIAGFELATTQAFNRFLTAQASAPLADMAANGLAKRWPALSAASGSVSGWRGVGRAMLIMGIAAALVFPSLLGEAIWTAFLTVAFLAFAVFRLLGGLVPHLPEPKPSRLPDARLPVYTVMVALYREATSVAPLMQAIENLDYPREKLDVILVTEADDDVTRRAIARLGIKPHVHVVTVPAIGPQTKPKALNYALPFAKGSFVAVFDAEDRPEPGQLRAALTAFAHHGDDLACVQASLCIDNGSESLLSRMFAAEYAGQFDVFLRGLSAMNLPLPLGGSSNHFRTDLLRHVGGWDAYNVTEDADLGIRLARFGYRSMTFASATYEEAPIHLGAWLRQRSRWMKGWMQTAGVHLMHPRQLYRDLGWRKSIAVVLIAGGNALTALAYPLLLVEALLWSISAQHNGDPIGLATNPLILLHLTAICAGYISTVTVGLLGLRKRRQLRQAWILLLAPVYWGLLSIAAWRALWQLLREPHRWEKTQHAVSPRSKAMRSA